MIHWILSVVGAPFYALAYVAGSLAGAAFHGWWKGWRS